MSDLFFSKPLCECSLEYGVAWFFFTLGNAFFFSMIWLNPINLNYGQNSNAIKFTLSCATLFIIGIFSRCICRTSNKYIELKEDLKEDLPYYG